MKRSPRKKSKKSRPTGADRTNWIKTIPNTYSTRKKIRLLALTLLLLRHLKILNIKLHLVAFCLDLRQYKVSSQNLKKPLSEKIGNIIFNKRTILMFKFHYFACKNQIFAHVKWNQNLELLDYPLKILLLVLLKLNKY